MFARDPEATEASEAPDGNTFLLMVGIGVKVFLGRVAAVSLAQFRLKMATTPLHQNHCYCESQTSCLLAGLPPNRRVIRTVRTACNSTLGRVVVV